MWWKDVDIGVEHIHRIDRRAHVSRRAAKRHNIVREGHVRTALEVRMIVRTTGRPPDKFVVVEGIVFFVDVNWIRARITNRYIVGDLRLEMAITYSRFREDRVGRRCK